ncbi:MAG: hypothetical protein L6R39_003988 [Caloplaca ligustica]|nr:MAG: hypothetical protein L6R39_003988 [Caloplaca ligustica]
MIVQVAKTCQERQGEWRRTALKGHAKTIVRLSVWAVGDLRDSQPKPYQEQTLMWLKVLLILPAEILLCFAAPFSRAGRIPDSYPIFFSRSWDYPTYPRNRLDASPNYARRLSNEYQQENPTQPTRDLPGVAAALTLGLPYDKLGHLERLLRPRKLMIKQRDGHWKLSDGTSQPYVVISYASRQFNDTQGHRDIEGIAEKMATSSGVEAYWVDYRCRAQDPTQLTVDVHQICDVFRGARKVYVVLPNLKFESKRYWGSRMWCLPEARKSNPSLNSSRLLISAIVLCPQQTIVFCSVQGRREEYTKVQLASDVWIDGKTTRLFAEHYTGLLNLSRIEFISLGLEVLSSRAGPIEELFYLADVAFALMSLLYYRLRIDINITLF